MLWEKESDEDDALYVDYFASFGDDLAFLDTLYEQSRPIAKFNDFSNQLREEGNTEFAAQNYTDAIKGYNYALCFAENGSVALSQAYANRSACYFQLDLFKESYIDNELAYKASECSDELKKRLAQNQRDCCDFKDFVDPCGKRESVPKLDFQPNEHFPSLANVLQIEPRSGSNAAAGHRIVANCDIDVGRIVLKAKSPVSKLMCNQYMRCNICLKYSHNLVPCTNCTNAMFCYGECQSSILHEAECNLNVEIDGGGKLSFLLRTVMYAISLFKSVDELMEFVERDNATAPSDLPLSMVGDRATYQNFSKLRPHSKKIVAKQRDPLIYFAYKAVMESSYGQMFRTLRLKRFLVHLIWQHMAIISLGYVHEFTNKKNQAESQNLSVTFNYFSHSCTPNAMFYLVGNWEVVTTVRPIEAGEEVFLSYFGKECFTGTQNDRQRNLDKLYNCFRFKCQCDLCEHRTATPDERAAMNDDLCYQSILLSFSLYDFKKIPYNHKQMKNQAQKFLRKFGRSKWCDELGQVAACFMDMTWLLSNP